jgi:hypothetical protein
LHLQTSYTMIKKFFLSAAILVHGTFVVSGVMVLRDLPTYSSNPDSDDLLYWFIIGLIAACVGMIILMTSKLLKP